jgi:hypothetical protein
MEAGSHGFHDSAVGIVVLESPDKCASETPRNARANVRSLEPHRDRVIVGPEGLRVGIIDPHGDSAGIEVARVSRQTGERAICDLAGRLQIIGRRKRSQTGGALIQPMVGAGNAATFMI